MNKNKCKSRFSIVEFKNRGGTLSWRVIGTKRDGARVRTNYADLEKAKAKQLELETEFLGYMEGQQPTLKQTNLSDKQLRIAEVAFLRLSRPEDLVPAVERWVQTGHKDSNNPGITLDHAVDHFVTWLDTSPFRDKTRVNLKSRTNIFRSVVGNIQLSEISPDLIDSFLIKRQKSAVTLDNDRRALSRFFRFCAERPRRWIAANPCRDVQVQKPEKLDPGILNVQQAKSLLTQARRHKNSKMLGYIALLEV